MKSYAGDVAKISYKGKTGYAAISDMGTVESIADEAVTTQKTRVYEKASTSSRYVTVAKGVKVNVLAKLPKGWLRSVRPRESGANGLGSPPFQRRKVCLTG